MKIVVLEAYAVSHADLSWDGLKSLGETVIYDSTPPELIVERIGDAEIVLQNRVSFTAALMDKCKKLRFIGENATGYNNIDIKAARERGITVCNIPAYSSPSVAQHTFALLLELCMHTGLHSNGVMAGKWNECLDFCYWETPLIELSGKTMGIIGFGQIGRAVATIAVSFGMKVIACAAHPRAESGVDGVSMVTMEELISSSDVISLHCPLTQENKGFICTETISKMRDGVIVINTARGLLVNEQDVTDALTSGKMRGFASDVLAKEPPVNGSPLFGAPNCIITPHIAWAPIESRKRLMNTAIENVRAFLSGEPQNKVNN